MATAVDPAQAAELQNLQAAANQERASLFRLRAQVARAEASLSPSLSLQIQATRDDLRVLQSTEAALQFERDALSLRAGAGGAAAAPPSPRAAEAATAAAAEELLHAAAVKLLESRGGRAAGEGAGDDGRLWREHALPNLALARAGGGVRSGMVVDRVFDGVAAFTPGVNNHAFGAAAGALLTPPPSVHSRGDDYELVSCAREVAAPRDAELVKEVVAQYSTLLIEDAETTVRLVAASSAVDCVQQVLEAHLPTPPAAAAAATALPRSPSAPAAGSVGAGAGVSTERAGERAIGKAGGDGRRRGSSDLSSERLVERQVPRMSHASKVLSPSVMADLLNAAPVRFRGSVMERLYCTDTDGIALGTLLSKVSDRSPVFLLIRDAGGNVFGCYGSAAWRDSCTRSYGSGECFVFRVVGEELEVFHWSRENSFFQVSSHEHLAIGGGGHFALWLDEDLCVGTTAECRTFGSPPLTPGRSRPPTSYQSDEVVDFDVVVVESWVPQAHLSTH